ncbi:MAG: hypothetical protein GXX85_14260 [Ignavibacteria bacterium]|nr:hypothetical protein [Ignavibacteria bacterium]
MFDLLDSEGYPTIEFLENIKNAKVNIIEIFSTIADAFHSSGYGKAKWSNNNKRLKLITGGWSGNEDIKSAMFENVFISICWCASVRGGVSIWDLREIREKEIKDLQNEYK